MNQMDKTHRLSVAMTRPPHLIGTIPSMKAITLHIHLKARRKITQRHGEKTDYYEITWKRFFS